MEKMNTPSRSIRRSCLVVSGLPALTVALACWGALAAAGPVNLVKDINQTPSSASSSNPSLIVGSNGVFYFSADDGVHGREFWKTDGTEAGTVMVTDIYPGPTGSDPQGFFDIKGKLFFSAVEQKYGRELWIHDDTAETPTHRVKDIFDGPTGSDPDSFTDLNSQLIFRADDNIHGKELWKTDGTLANTKMIKDIVAGSAGSYPQFLTVVGQNVYFRTDDRHGLYGMELYRTNGDASGTILVDDINPGPGGSYPNYFAVLNGSLYFRANDGGSFKKGYELWYSDGGSTVTTRLKDIWPGDSSSDPQSLITIGSTIFFNANDGTHGRELWKTDGTENGTVMVKDINPGYNGSTPYNLFDGGGKLFFNANETDTGYELWVSDGTEAGTILLHSFEKGPTPPDSYQFNEIYTQNDLIFPAYDAAHGWELWRSDGTPQGTGILVDQVPGPGSSYSFPLSAWGEGLLVSADDGTVGRELYRIDPAPSISVSPSGPVEFPIGVWLTTGTLTSVTRTVTVTNNGAFKDLTFTGNKATISGTDAASFNFLSAPPDTLAAGKSFDIAIKFTPTTKTDKSATLVITTDDPDHGTVQVPLVARVEPRGFMAH